MKRLFTAKTFAALAVGTTLAGLAPAVAAANVLNLPSDVLTALQGLPRAQVTVAADDGVPTFLQGDLGHVGVLPLDGVLADLLLRTNLGPALAPLRLLPTDLGLRRVRSDDQGNRHFRYEQKFQGLDVIGGNLVVHVDAKGTVYALNGSARGLPTTLGSIDIGVAAAARYVAADPRFAGMSLSPARPVFLVDGRGGAWKAYEFTASGQRGADPARDLVYADVASGAIVAVHPQIEFARQRKLYNANNGTKLPGTLVRTETQGPIRDSDVNASFDNLGATYDAYLDYFQRDSINNAGAALIGSVHYGTTYCNAFWNGTQMVFGDGDPSVGCGRIARALDVTAHELTHGVTKNESNLIYQGESGGLNESMSDVFGAFVEAWVDGGRNGALQVSADTWTVAEDVYPYGFRYLDDPAKDGASLDYYTGDAGQNDVHYSSGIANLAFYLMAQGGVHPRHTTTVPVAGIGMEKAIRIFYKANVDILTSGSGFLTAANATVQAAQELGYDLATQTSVSDAWRAVGVNAADPGAGGSETTLVNGVPVTGLQDSKAGQKFFRIDVPRGAGGLKFTLTSKQGDADLYVRHGSHPTLSAYDCRPYKAGTASETCTFSVPAPGTWYVMLNAYTAYSGATLTASYTAPPPVTDDVPVLSNGVPVIVSGDAGSEQFWKITTPAGKKLTISISGGTGDADLYVRLGSKPTTTTYDCRPYLNGVAETCPVNNTVAGTYYVMVRGYDAFSGVSLKASSP